MKKLYTIFICLTVILLVSCKDEATIEVSNNVKNIKLEYISFGEDVPITTGLSTGETAQVSIDDKMNNIGFPMQENIMFYMSSGDHKVLLYTKTKYTLTKNDYLQVIISDTTQVLNPATNISNGDEDNNDITSILSQLSIWEFGN